jgi:hypothetical protein
MVKFVHHIGIRKFFIVTLIYVGVLYFLNLVLIKENLIGYLIQIFTNFPFYLFLIFEHEKSIIIKDNILVSKIFLFITEKKIDILQIRKIYYQKKKGFLNKLMKHYLYVQYSRYDGHNVYIKQKEELIEVLLKINPNIEVVDPK